MTILDCAQTGGKAKERLPPIVRWLAASAQVAGSSHVRAQIPCQDAVIAEESPIPHLVVCDGRGSARFSDRGSAYAVCEFSKWISDNRPLVRGCLSSYRKPRAACEACWRELVVHHILPALYAKQRAVSLAYAKPIVEFECTISAVVVGTRYTGWLQLGDSGIVVVGKRKTSLVCAPQQGEYINQTLFLNYGSLATEVTQTGLRATRGIQAVFGFTDGVQSRLFDLRRKTPGPCFAQIAQHLQREVWSEESLQRLLEHPIWSTATSDDRSLGCLVLLHA